MKAENEEDKDRRGVIEDHPLSAFKVDPIVQRPLTPGRVEQMANNFDYKAFGTPVVSRRSSGMLVILDGQHRIEARRLYNTAVFPAGEFADEMIPVEVFHGITLAQEAEIFIGRNNMRPVSALYKFLVRITAQDADAVAVNALVHKYGWKLGTSGSTGVMTAVTALERAYVRNPWALEQALKVLTEVWNHDGESGDGRIVSGLAHFFDFHKTSVAVDDLVSKMRQIGPASSLIGRARVTQDVLGCGPQRAVAHELTVVYNKYRKNNVLPAVPTGKA